MPLPHVLISGGGPAGLGAAYELTRQGVRCTLFEERPRLGGHSRTEHYKGYHFDIGGHRFFSKVDEVNRLWREVLCEDLLRRPRLSRIYYDGTFFNYPLKPLNALRGLGLARSIGVAASYAGTLLTPKKEAKTFEDWVSARFGRRLYEIFFKSYTEKVWGIPCTELDAEWAAQRIMGLSLYTAVRNALLPGRGGIKTLIEEFDYPRLGPGMMYDRMAACVEEGGGTIQTKSRVVGIEVEPDGSVIATVAGANREERHRGTHLVSSMPISELALIVRNRSGDEPPREVRKAAAGLRYRDFVSVNLILNRRDLFPDNWIYIHSPDVKLGRIQNYKNWSPDMVADPERTALGLEYFCFEGDAFWNTQDEELLTLGALELERIGLAQRNDVEDGQVVREPKAYPIYDPGYRERVAALRRYLDTFATVQTIGRYGLFRYNNMDHAILTGLYAARNIVAGRCLHSVFDVNADDAYLEESRTAGSPTAANIPS